MRQGLVVLLALAVVFGGFSLAAASVTVDGDAGIEATQYLRSWGSDINKVSSNTVKLMGFTQANQIVDQISVTLYLERKEGSTWKTISGGYSLSKPNAVEISRSQNVTVTSGCCYRTRAVHKVANDGVSESKVSYSTELQM